MSKMSFSGDKRKGKFTRFLSSRAFYVALAVCLIGASAATWMAVNRTITGIEDSNSQILENEIWSNYPDDAEETAKPDATVPKQSELFSPPASSSSTSSSSPEQPSEPGGQSEQPAASPVLPTPVFRLPVDGEILNPHSGGELVKNMTLGDWRTHDGIDIAAPKNAEVYAAADGVVIDIANDPLWGTTITVRHADNSETIYCGLQTSLPIQVGETVQARQVIGRVDGVPCEINEDSHIHFAMRKEGAWVDPMDAIGTEQ